MIVDTFDMAALESELTVDEGKRSKPYLDTRNNTTIGIGHNLAADGLCDAAILAQLQHDVDVACYALDGAFSWWRKLPAAGQRVMVNLTFNMGVATLAQFSVFLDHMCAREWGLAAIALQASQWYREVGSRGPRMQDRIMRCGGPAPGGGTTAYAPPGQATA